MKSFKRSFGIALLSLGLTGFTALAQPSLGSGGTVAATPLNYWTFSTTNWLSADGHSPLAFTNLSLSTLGDGNASLLLDSTIPPFCNTPSWKATATRT